MNDANTFDRNSIMTADEPVITWEKTSFILTRHGETNYNRLFMLQGHIDTDVNKLGIIQARDTARKLESFKIDMIYSSDLKRAKHTAEIISEIIAAPLSGVSTKLREGYFGDLEGKTYEEISSVTGVPMERLIKGGLDGLPQTEPPQSVYNRAMEFLHEIAVEHPGRTILIVTHGGVMRAIAGAMLSLEFSQLHFNNGSLFRLDFTKNAWFISIQ